MICTNIVDIGRNINNTIIIETLFILCYFILTGVCQQVGYLTL